MGVKTSSIFFVVLICAKNAFAYIDPGTGGLVLGSIWPMIIAILAAIGAFFVKYFFKPIKKRITSTWQKIRKKE